MRKATVLVLILTLLASGLVFAAGGDEKGADVDLITLHWAQWAPADYLQQLSAKFTEESGIDVIVEQTPWETFVQKYNVEMIAHSDAWDIIVGDSQDIGTMAEGGHYVELTDWVKANNVDKDFTAASMTSYAEWPKGSGRYYAVPAEGDALGWAYRTDLFEDPDNMAAFEAQYGYKLDVPRDWEAMLDIAEFFDDPDNSFYGISIYGDNGYDSLVMFGEQSQWSFGGALGDYTTFQLEGILNGEGSIRGLEYYKELFQYTPPGFGDAFFVKANDAFTAGIVPMTCNFFGFLPALANQATNPYAADTGFFVTPPQMGVDGTMQHYTALGGQGASVVSYSKKQDAAMQWMDWFIRPEVQEEWAALGGYTTHIDTLASDTFLNATPYNPAFKESMEIFRDFWALPEYGQLFESYAKIVGAYIVRGEGTAEEALNKVLDVWTGIFKEAGYIQ